MLDKLSFLIGVCLLMTGVFILHLGFFERGGAQTAGLVAGACLFSLGLIMVSIVMKKWWEWKQYWKEEFKNAERSGRR